MSLQNGGENKFNLSFIEVMPIGELSISRHEQYLSVDFAKSLTDKKFGLIDSNYKTLAHPNISNAKSLNLQLGSSLLFLITSVLVAIG